MTPRRARCGLNSYIVPGSLDGLALLRQILHRVVGDLLCFVQLLAGRLQLVLPHVHGDHPLGFALARMGSTRHTVLPVVSRANVRTMLGVVTLPDILHVYGVERVDEVPDLTRRLDD